MIVWNEKVKKSEDVIKAVINQLYKDQINTDGVVEIFNNGKEQGCVLKLFDKYNPNLDLCIWAYLPNNRKMNNHMEIIIGKHINCNNLNMWDGADLELFPIFDKIIKIDSLLDDDEIDHIFEGFQALYHTIKIDVLEPRIKI